MGSQIVHMVFKDLLRLSDGLANRAFCQSDISRVQLKSNWTVGESLVAFGQEAVREWRLNFFKGQWISFERASGWCNVALGDMLRVSDGLGNRSFCWSDILRAQLKSNWTVGERLEAFDQEAVREWRLNLIKWQWIFLQYVIWKIIHLENIASGGAVSQCSQWTLQIVR